MDRKVLDFLRFFTRRYPSKTVTMLVLLIISGLTEAIGIMSVLPVLQAANGTAIDGRVARILSAVGLPSTLGVLLTLIVVGIALKSVFLWLAMREVGFTMAHVTAELRLRLLDALLKAKWRYFASRPKGHLANAINMDAQRAAAAFREACAGLALVIQAIIYAILSFLVSWQATIIGVISGLVFVFLLRRLVTMASTAGEQQTQLMRALMARLIDALYGIKPIKAMGQERQLLPLLRAETEGLNEASQRQVHAGETLRLFQEPFVTVVLAIGLYVLLDDQRMEFAKVMTLAFIFYRLLQLITGIQMRYQIMTLGVSAFWSLHDEIRQAEEEREGTTGTLHPPPLAQNILFDNVTFGYDDHRVLNGVSLEIPANAMVAIVGPSGAGKTTIADLLLGLHLPSDGAVRIDGVPLSTIDLAHWRHRIGYVPQDTLLFHDTVYRNVTLGDDSLSRDDVETALRAAGAWDFVASRPGGLDEVLGEQGVKISGGQRQRISIARALVRKPLLLILDEATTALDAETEASVCEALLKLRHETTILAISHQAALRDAADIVYELDGGRIRTLTNRSAGQGADKAIGN